SAQLALRKDPLFDEKPGDQIGAPRLQARGFSEAGQGQAIGWIVVDEWQASRQPVARDASKGLSQASERRSMHPSPRSGCDDDPAVHLTPFEPCVDFVDLFQGRCFAWIEREAPALDQGDHLPKLLDGTPKGRLEQHLETAILQYFDRCGAAPKA